MKKALIVASVPSFLQQFLLPNIKELQRQGFEVEVACNFVENGNISTGRKNELIKLYSEININYHHINFSRSPLPKQTILAYKQLKKLIDENGYKLIHCHTPVAGILTRLAAIKVRKNGTKVIYTAHGFHFYKNAPLINWIIYYTAEKICSYFTDVLITINTDDYEIAKKKFKTPKVYYIPGVGIDTEKFESVEIDKTEKRKPLGLTDENIVLLSVGELNENKNHQVVIKALANLQNKNIHYCIAGVGEWEEKLLNLAKEKGIEENFHLLGYRKDVPELFQIADIFVHPSHREGLSVATMEALASGLPCIESNTRGNTDLVIDEKGGFLPKSTDIEAFEKAIKTLSENKNQRKTCGEHNKNHIKTFDIKNVEEIMRKIYGEVLI